MRSGIYRYGFEQAVQMEEVEATLQLAVVATEGIYGGSDVRLDASFAVDDSRRTIVIDATSDVGRCICRIFTGFLANEFGEDAFHVRRVDRDHTTPASIVTDCESAPRGA